MNQFRIRLPIQWVPLKKISVMSFFPLVLLAAFGIMALNPSYGFPYIFFFGASLSYLYLVSYLVFFSGNEPMIVGGVDLRKIQAFYRYSLIPQAAATILAWFVLATGFNSSFFEPTVFSLFYLISIQFFHSMAEIIANLKLDLDFVSTLPSQGKLTMEELERETASLFLRKIYQRTS